MRNFDAPLYSNNNYGQKVLVDGGGKEIDHYCYFKPQSEIIVEDSDWRTFDIEHLVQAAMKIGVPNIKLSNPNLRGAQLRKKNLSGPKRMKVVSGKKKKVT